MGAYGWHNPFPFEYGGGETEDELIYNAMRKAMGKNGSATDDSGIDGLWRQCKAQALASIGTFAERAIMQAFPNRATDHLGVYEELLMIVPRAGESDEERRIEIVVEWTSQIAADCPGLALQLQLIDPRASILDQPRSLSTITELGKAFRPQDGSPSFGPRVATSYPNFASEYFVPVLLNLGGSPVPGSADQLVVQRIKRVLRKVLPSWVDFVIVTSLGFTLDLSPLDVTAMT